MPGSLSTGTRWSAVGGLILLLALTSVGRAQIDKDTPRHSTLCILVHVKTAGYKAKDIEETLAEGADNLKYKYSQIRAVPLKPETLAELQRIISSLESIRATGAPGTPIITQKASDAMMEWEFNLNVDEPGIILRKLEIVVTKNGNKETREFELKASNKPEDTVSRTPQTGVYVVRLPANEIPGHYAATYQSTKSRDGKTVEGDWPKPEKSFLVTVKDFEGDYRKLLQEVKRDPATTKQKVANPLEDVELGGDIAMVFASVGFKLRRTGITIDENRWVPIVQGIEQTDSDRVWMLFPLSRDLAEKKLKEYRELGSGDLAKKIRAEKPLWAKDSAEMTIDDQNLSPNWIELPKGDKGFSREMRFKDVKALYKKLPEAYRLIVYELGTQDVGRVQAVQDPVSASRVFIISESIKEWPEGIKEAASKVKDK